MRIVNFAMPRGLTAHELSEYQQENFGSFLGSFYLDTNRSKTLKKGQGESIFPG